MTQKIKPDTVYVPSPDVVSREIEGVIVIIPIVSGMGDLENELFSLNETGKAVWRKMDGSRTMSQVISELAGEYQASEDDIREDVNGLVSELLKRRMIVEKGEA